MKQPIQKKVTVDYAKIITFVKSLDAVGSYHEPNLPAFLAITKTNDSIELNEYLSINVKSNVKLLTIKARNNKKIEHISTVAIPISILTEKILADSIDSVIASVGIDKDKTIGAFILDHFLK